MLIGGEGGNVKREEKNSLGEKKNDIRREKRRG